MQKFSLPLFILKIISLLFSFLFIHGCAFMQPISVTTYPAAAVCTLTNDKGRWMIRQTPALVTVRRSQNNLLVICQKYGYENAVVEVSSFAIAPCCTPVCGINLWNRLGAKLANNTTYNYPAAIHVTLNPYCAVEAAVKN